MKAIMVDISPDGNYVIPDYASEQDWTAVQAEADSVEKLDDLKNWYPWTAVYLVELAGDENTTLPSKYTHKAENVGKPPKWALKD